MSNLQPSTSFIPQDPVSAQATQTGSPVTFMHAHPSTPSMPDQPQHFSTLPPSTLSGPLGPLHQARQNQSTAPIEPSSPTSTKESTLDRPRRTSSMTINPSIISAPQPQTQTATSPQQQYYGDVEGLSLTRTTSSVNMDGEPRIFPGVVTRSARRSSMRSGAVEDGAYAGYRKGGGDTESVKEEVDTDDEE